MPMSSPRAAGACPILRASKPRCAPVPIIRSVSPGTSYGSDTGPDADRHRGHAPARLTLSGNRGLAGTPLVAAAVQDDLAQSGLIIETKRGQNGTVGIRRTDQALALQRDPNRGIAQPASVAARHYGLAEVEMVAVRLRRPHR